MMGVANVNLVQGLVSLLLAHNRRWLKKVGLTMYYFSVYVTFLLQ